jgi:hypothetical protein
MQLVRIIQTALTFIVLTTIIEKAITMCYCLFLLVKTIFFKGHAKKRPQLNIKRYRKSLVFINYLYTLKIHTYNNSSF